MSTSENKRAPRNPNHIDIGGKTRAMLEAHISASRLYTGKKTKANPKGNFKYNIGDPYRKTVSGIVTSLTAEVSEALLSLLIQSGKPVKVTTGEGDDVKVTTKNSTKQVNQDLMEGACRLVFLPELFNEMKIAADIAVKKFQDFTPKTKKVKGKKQKGTSASEKAGLVLPVPRFRNFLKNAFSGRGIRATVAVYLTAVMEKLIAIVNEGTLRELETGKHGSTFTPTALQSFYLQRNLNSDTNTNKKIHVEQYFLRYTFRNMIFSTTVKYTFPPSKAAVKRENTSGTKKAKATSSSAKKTKSPRSKSPRAKSPRATKKTKSPRATKKTKKKSKKTSRPKSPRSKKS